MSISRAAFATAFAFTFPAAAFAEDAINDDAETILIIGQTEKPITVVPRGLSVSLGEAEFAAINALNVEDLMKYAPNFFVRKRFAGDDNAVVALRGANTVQSARTIVMVDGFVVSNFLGNRYDFPPKWNVVGPAEVRQLDIVYGPYSARYGGNSMGGVISVTTEEPHGTEVHGTVQTMFLPFHEYGLDENFHGYSFEGGASWKQSDGPWSARASFRHFYNVGQSMSYKLLTPATGSGTAVTGAYTDPRIASPIFGAASPVHVTQDQARLRLGYVTGGGWQIDALGLIWKTRQRLTDSRSWLIDADTGAPVYQGKVSYDGKTWNATGLNMSQTDRMEFLAGLKLAGPLAAWDVRLNLSHYWIPQEETRSSKDYMTGASLGAGTLEVVGTPGWYTGDLIVERGFGAHKMAFGANANRYEASSTTYNSTNWKTAAGQTFNSATYGKTSLWGLWLEDSYGLGGGVTLTGGIRYDRWRAFAGGITKAFAGDRVDNLYPSRHDDAVSPSFSLQGPLANDLNFQISLGIATRFPTVGELFQGKFDNVTQAIDPDSFDPGLKPEKSQDANLILRHDFGKVHATASLFYQSIDDAIFSFSGTNQYGNTVSSYKNVDRVRQYGVELILEAKNLLIDGLDIDGNAAWTDAKTLRNSSNTLAEGKQFPRVPKWRSNGNIRYQVSDPMKLSVGWRYASRPNSDLFGLVRGDAYGFQSEYFTMDTRLSYNLSKTLQLSAGVDNLFNDQAYVSHPLPQRTFVADLKATW